MREKPVYGIIYKVTNEKTGKLYIGLTTKSLFMRKADHKFRAKFEDKRSAFQLALLVEGLENFRWEEIDHAESKEELSQKEKHWVAYFKADDPNFGYNILGGGIDAKHTAETKRKMSEYAQNRPFEHRRKLSEAHKGKQTGEKNPMYGKTHTEEARKRISEGHKGITTWNKGKHHSEETRRKISEANKKKMIGDIHPRSTITEETARQIKIDLQAGIRICDIARKHKVKKDIVSNIKRGHSWTWLIV